MTGFFNNPDEERMDEDIEEVEFRTPAKRARVLDNFPPDGEEPIDELHV